MITGHVRAISGTWWIGVFVVAIGCGGDDAAPSNQTGGVGAGGSSSSGGGPTSGVGGSSGAGGASGGAAGSNSAGSGGSAAIDCSGTFGTPRELLAAAPNDELGGVTLSPDELELFYSSITLGAADGSHFYRSTRASKADVFVMGTPVPELDAACQVGQRRTMDLSHDGLRAFLVCVQPDGPMYNGPLRIAERPSLGAPFVLRAMTYGEIGNSPSISRDELTLYSTHPDGSYDYIQRYERNTTSAAFGRAADVLLGALNYPSSPDIGPDDLTLFFGVNATVGAATRPSTEDEFSAATELFTIPPPNAGGAPEISRDCRSLYYINLDSSAGGSSIVFSIRVATR
jgi:hypothetical protein